MTQTGQAVANPDSLPTAARIGWLVLILATLYLCYFHNLGAIGFVGPDEPRYAWIARDMVETDDWVTPKLYGKPWFEKPVLYYWVAALSFKLFGVSEAAARLPSAIAALLATLAMAWFAWGTYGAETARWALLLLPTTVGMIGFSHAAAMDMPFASTLTVALVCAAVILGIVPIRGPLELSNSTYVQRTVWLLLFGFFLGLAVLAKGPVAIILSGGGVLCWAFLTKRWRDTFRCLHPVAIASFCLTALPWYIVCARRNPDFFRVFIIEHNFKRYLTPEFQHIQPFWFYVPVVLIAFAPWALVMLWLVVLGILRIKRNYQVSYSTVLLLCWAVFCLLFFTTSKSKLPGYILPAIPAIGVLFSRAFVLFAVQIERGLRWLISAYAMLFLLAGLGLIALGRRFYTSRSTTEAMVVIGCVVLAFALANLLLTLKKHAFPLAALCVIPVFLLIANFSRLAHPWFGRDPSGRTLAAELRANQIPADQVSVAQMKRGQLYSLSFYLNREIEPWNPAQISPGFLLLSSRRCDDLVSPTLACAAQPIELRMSGWFVYRVENRESVRGLDGFGSLRGGGGNNRNRSNREPR